MRTIEIKPKNKKLSKYERIDGSVLSGVRESNFLVLHKIDLQVLIYFSQRKQNMLF